MTLKCVAFCIFCVFLSCGLKAQNPAVKVPVFYEKVFLHTDKNTYRQSENLWFKAYLVNAQNNRPINYSHSLYVELIAPNLTIVRRLIIRLENGLGNGDFKLSDTLSTGNYRIRAYTNYMRNFGNKFIFEKTVRILDVGISLDPAAVAGAKIAVAKKRLPTAAMMGLPIISFFPEGGSMVNDVRSKIAVRAEDVSGKGIAVAGKVIATSGRTVAKFNCDSLGMGVFSLEPDETQSYHAEVVINGEQKNFKLPEAMHSGFVLSVNTTPSFIIASINCNGFQLKDYSGSNLIIEAGHGGRIYYKQQILVQSNLIIVQIPDLNFPEGIACITLYDEHRKALCERLTYINGIKAPNIGTSADKQIYTGGEKVTITLKPADTTALHLSFAAVDAGNAPVKFGDIVEYLMLKSELKGNIERPERYFDTTNTNRLGQLDLLLLTQGWRDFIWKSITPAKTTDLGFEVEQGVPVTGTVRQVWNNRPMPGMHVTMFAPKAEREKLFTSVTDSAGRFSIDGAVFYGYQYLHFTSRKSDGIKDDGTSKGKSGGSIQVDSLAGNIPLIAANTDTDTSPQARELSSVIPAEKKFTFSGVNTLNTVQINGETNVLPPLIQPITLKEQKDYQSLMNYLLYNIPDSHTEFVHAPNIKSLIYEVMEVGRAIKGDPCRPYMLSISGVYADNSKIDYKNVRQADYLNLAMSDILKVTIFRHKYPCGIYYNVGLILRAGALEVKDAFDNTMADVVGYYRARKFFVPGNGLPDETPFPGSTIYWEPNIEIRYGHPAVVTFRAPKANGKIIYLVQGVSDNGFAVTAAGSCVIK